MHSRWGSPAKILQNNQAGLLRQRRTSYFCRQGSLRVTLGFEIVNFILNPTKCTTFQVSGPIFFSINTVTFRWGTGWGCEINWCCNTATHDKCCFWSLEILVLRPLVINDPFRTAVEGLWFLDQDLVDERNWPCHFLLVDTTLLSKESILPCSPYIHPYRRNGQGQKPLGLVSVGTSPQLITGGNMTNFDATFCHGLLTSYFPSAGNLALHCSPSAWPN